MEEEEEDVPPLPYTPLTDKAKDKFLSWQKGDVLNRMINPYLPCVLTHVITSIGNDLVSYFPLD